MDDIYDNETDDISAQTACNERQYDPILAQQANVAAFTVPSYASLGQAIRETPAQIAQRMRYEAKYERREYLQMALNVAGNFRTVDEVIEAAEKFAEYVKGTKSAEADIVERFSSEPKLDGMLMYLGTKALYARPMTRGEYNTYQGWTLPEDENPDDLGWIVQYSDGYISWSPADVFADSYQRI